MGLIYTNPQKFNSGIHLNGATPLDDRLQINDISDIYISNTTTGTAGCAIYGMAYDGMVISVVNPNHDHSKDVILIQLKDATPYKYGSPGEVNENNFTEYWTVSISGDVSFDTSVIDASIKYLESTTLTLNRNYTTLNNKVNTLNSSVNTLDSDINNIQTDITSIKQKNISQDSSLNILDSSIRDILTDITSIKQKNISQDSSLNTFDSSIRDLYNKPETQTSPVYLKDGQSGYVLGDSNNAPGENAFAEGNMTTASGEASHAEGGGSIASGDGSHAEGEAFAFGAYSHAEGYDTSAMGNYSHTEGNGTQTTNEAEHASGKYNKSTKNVTQFSVGVGIEYTRKNAFEITTDGSVYINDIGDYNGTNVTSAKNIQYVVKTINSSINTLDTSVRDLYINGSSSGSSGDSPVYLKSGLSGYVLGDSNDALGENAFAYGYYTNAEGDYSHAEGLYTTASGENSHAEGYETRTGGDYSHADGYYTYTSNVGEHACGKYNYSTSGKTQFSVGIGTDDLYDRKNALEITNDGKVFIYDIGNYNGRNIDDASSLQDIISSGGSSSGGGGYISYTEYKGYILGDSGNTAEGLDSFAEGNQTSAGGDYSHAEGNNSSTSADSAHAEGYYTSAFGNYSHTEGYYTTADGEASHAEGKYTQTTNEAEHASGMYNNSTEDLTQFSVGIGTDDDNRINAFEITNDGNIFIYNMGDYDGTNASYATPLQDIISGSYITYNEDQGYAVGNDSNVANGTDSFAVGYNTTAEGAYSFAEGNGTHASGENGSHAEGCGTTATGENGSHAEGNGTYAIGENGSHAEGNGTHASGESSHAEGYGTTASGESSHAEGCLTSAEGKQSHAEGNGTNATGNYSHAEGEKTTASGGQSHAEGFWSNAIGNYSHAEGYYTQTTNEGEHASGKYNKSTENVTIFSVGVGNSELDRKNAFEITLDGKIYIKDIGNYNGMNVTDSDVKAIGENGWINLDIGNFSGITKVDGYNGNSYAIGGGVIDTLSSPNIDGAFAVNNSTVSGNYAFACGYYCKATGVDSHAEGERTTASGKASHTEGGYTTATNEYSHAEGRSNDATGKYSHAEGFSTDATGTSSHSEGSNTAASGDRSHAEGYYSRSIGANSHAEGWYTTTKNTAEHACGTYNFSNKDITLFSIGCGNEGLNGGPTVRQNAIEVDNNGNVYIKGIGRYNGQNISDSSSVLEVINFLMAQHGN